MDTCKHSYLQRLWLQVVIELESVGTRTRGAFRGRLQSLLGAWRNEQRVGANDSEVQLVLDLNGRELTIETDQEIPSRSTLRHGTLLLTGTSCVSDVKESPPA